VKDNQVFQILHLKENNQEQSNKIKGKITKKSKEKTNTHTLSQNSFTHIQQSSTINMNQNKHYRKEATSDLKKKKLF